MKKFIATFALCISLTFPAPSHALFGAGDIVFDIPQTIQSLFEFFRKIGVDAKTAYSEAEQYVYQYKDELMMIKAGIDDAEKIMRLGQAVVRLSEANDIAGMIRLAQDYSVTMQELDVAKWTYLNWDEFGISQFMQVCELIGKGDAIGTSASAVDAMFANKYEGWESYKDQVYNTGMFMDKYSEWSAINRDTIKVALKTIGIHAEGIKNEADLMKKLKEKTLTAEGQNQILQVTNEMASVGVDQMMDMKSLLMVQTQMQSAFYASEQDQHDLLNAQHQSHQMREYTDGLKPVVGNSKWDTTGFKLKD